MDIGAVVGVKIDDEERMCVIVDKKYYCDISFEGDIIPPFLTRYVGQPNNFEYNTIIHPRKSENIGDKIICYEIMYGDNRVWVLENQFLSMVKVL